MNVAYAKERGDVTVYGRSDDLIELDGTIRDEFSGWGDEPHYLAFDEGTVLSIVYGDEGIWRIEIVERGTASVIIEPCVRENEDDDEPYSDIAKVFGVKRVACWDSWPPHFDNYVEVLEDVEFDSLGRDALERIHEIVAKDLAGE